jgi:hypothetical protein
MKKIIKSLFAVFALLFIANSSFAFWNTLSDYMSVERKKVHDKSGREYFTYEIDDFRGIMVIGTHDKNGNPKAGTMDKAGNIILPVTYDGLQRMADASYNYSLAAVKNGKCGVINDKGTVLIPFIYDVLSPYGYGLIFVKKDGKEGMIDIHNRILIPVQYDKVVSSEAVDFPPKHFLVVKGDKIAVVNEVNKIIVPYTNEDIRYDEDKKAFYVYEANNQTRYYSPTGRQWVEKR